MAKKNLTRAQALKQKKKRKKKIKTASIIGGIIIVIIAIAAVLCIFVFDNNTTNETVVIDGENIVVESQDIGSLEGIWEIEYENTPYTWTFTSSGSGIYCMDSDPISFVYVAKDGRLYINFLDEKFSDCEYTYTVDGDKLTLIAENGTGGGTYELTRALS